MASPFLKKTKKKSNLRIIQTEDDESEASYSNPASPAQGGASDADLSFQDSPSSAIAAAKAKAKAGKKKKAPETRLSFGGGDEDDESSPSTFVPKKSALSRALHIPVPPSSPSASSSYAPQLPSTPVSSSYSKDYINELKASTPSAPPSRPPIDQTDDELDANGWSKAAREKYGDMIVDDVATSIPNANEILAAKARRTKLRLNPNAEEFISLDGQSGTVKIRDAYDMDRGGPHPDSRLVREEDEEGDGADDHAEFTEANERIPLGKKANRDAARRMKAGIVEMIDDAEDDGSDEEGREWEEAQIRRAAKWEDEKVEKVKQPYRPTPIPATLALPSLSSASSRLAAALSTLTVSHAEHASRLEAVDRDRAALDTQEEGLRKEVGRVEKKYEWAREFKGWIEEVGKFLEVKYPELEKIESENISLLTERYSILSVRRLADDSDDLSLSLGVPLPSSSASLLPSVLPSSSTDQPPQSLLRQARRQTRLSRFPPSTLNSAEEQGLLTDEELSGDLDADYRAAKEDLRKRVEGLFSDVGAEDFRDPSVGLARRFAVWRREYGEEYEGAFGGLGMVGAWEFWARGEMGDWDPLRSDRSLASFDFYSSLHEYSRPRGQRSDSMMSDEDEEAPLGPDGDLVAAIVGSTVVPRLMKLFEAGAYDPYSSRETRKAVDMVEQVEEFVGRETGKFQTFISSLLAPFSTLLQALTSLVLLSQQGSPPPAFDPLSIPSRVRFLYRLTKLIRNTLAFRSYAPERVAELANGFAEVGRIVAETDWEGEGRGWAEKLVKGLPRGVLEIERERRLVSGPPRGW